MGSHVTACLAGSHKTESFSGGKNRSSRGFLIIFDFYARAFSAVVAPLPTSRHIGTNPVSLSALAILHSLKNADSDDREAAVDGQLHPIHVAQNRLKQETARPSQFPQDDPSFPVGSEIRTSPLSPCRVAGSPVSRPDPGSARSPGYSCPSVRWSHVRANQRQNLRALGKAWLLRCPSREIQVDPRIDEH